MLNYLKAELYKLVHQREFCVSLSLLLVLEGLLVAAKWLLGLKWVLNQSVIFLCGVLPVGFFLIYPLGTLIFSEQYKNNTLKNEISFSLSRRRIYLGKLLAAAILCTAVCALAIAFYLGISWIVFPVAPGDGLPTDMGILGYCLLIAFPLWLGALSLLHMLQFVMKSTVLYTVLYIAYFMAFEPLISMLTELNEQFQNTFFPAIHAGLLSTPLGELTGNLTPVLGWAWLVGMGWVLVTTGVGLFIFSKKDIK